MAKKSQNELDAIKRAFNKKDLPQHRGIQSGGGQFVMNAAQRRGYDQKKKQAQARAAAVA